MNAVQTGSFPTLHYRLTGPQGEEFISTFSGKPATLTLGTGQLSPGMEARLIGLQAGAHERFQLAPGEAFGERNPDLVQRVKRELVEDLSDPEQRYEPGDVVQFPAPDGQGTFSGVLREMGDDWMLFDFNHPLAGQAVGFEVQLIGVL